MGCMTTTLQWYDCTYTVPESGKKQCVSLHFDHWVAEKCTLRRWDMRIQIDDLYLVAGHHAAQAWLPPDAACFHACFPDSCVHWDPDSCLHWDLRIANGIFGNKRLAETCKEAAEKCSCVAWECAHVQPLLEFSRSSLAIYLTFFAPWQVAMGRWASNALTWVSGTCVRCAKKLGIACRGNREEILSRLSAFPPGAIRAAWGFGRRSAEKHQGKTPAKEESIDQLRQHVLPDGNKRRRVEPERYSPNTSVEDDDGSNWDGISLDSSSVKSTVKEVETISDGEWFWKRFQMPLMAWLSWGIRHEACLRLQAICEKKGAPLADKGAEETLLALRQLRHAHSDWFRHAAQVWFPPDAACFPEVCSSWEPMRKGVLIIPIYGIYICIT